MSMKKPDLLPADYHRGCASFLALLKPFMNMRETSHGIECQITLANAQLVKATGKDQSHLLLNLMSKLVEVMPEACVDEQDLAQLVSHSVSATGRALETNMHSTVKAEHTKERSDSGREAIGLTTKVSLHATVKAIAKKRGISASAAAGELLQDGLTRFDKESRIESPLDLLIDYERKANDHEGHETEHWIIRADRRLVMRTRLRAGEYGRSASSFANFILAKALIHCPVAADLQGTMHIPALSEESIGDAIKKLEQASGPKAKALAVEVGLGEQRSLINMILGGGVIAPARVLDKLAVALRIPLNVLAVCLERRFHTQSLPSFKATEGKPKLNIERQPWNLAVKELQLPATEEARLLRLEG